MVDEAYYFKNAMIATKMRNVAGISQTESQKSSDMLMKCMYPVSYTHLDVYKRQGAGHAGIPKALYQLG